MNRKPTIALFSSSEGHHSLAEALRQTLDSQYQVVTYHQDLIMQPLYVLVYRFFPQLFKIPYLLSRNTFLSGLAHRSYYKKHQAKMDAFIQQYQPDLCISTYFMYAGALTHYRLTNQIPFINLIANSWSIHPVELSSAAAVNVAFDQHSLELCRALNPRAATEAWGWFVRDEYEAEYSVTEIRQQLKLPVDRFTLLLAGGSEGNYQIARLMPFLLNLSIPLNIIVICGSNEGLKGTIDQLIKTTPHQNKHVMTLGFTTQLYRYLRAADLIVGKAGPNLLFEAVATQTPFFAICHIAGQEDGNLDIIRAYQLGFVEENLGKAEALLQNILETPEMLEQFRAPIAKLADYNRQAKRKLLSKVAKLVSQYA